MKSWNKPTNDEILHALAYIKTDKSRQYFFSKLKNPLWIKPLEEKGFFRNPPVPQKTPDGYIHPFWPELQFLKNVAGEDPDQVVSVVSGIDLTDNLRLIQDVIDIVLNVEASISIQLKSKILDYIQGKSFIAVDHLDDVLCHWADGGQTESALELAAALMKFKADPQAGRPGPLFSTWEYQEILGKGIQALADSEPYQTARVLIKAVENMIYLRFDRAQLETIGERDYSTVWCERVFKTDKKFTSSNECLVHALTHACEKVFEKTPEMVSDLEKILKKQRWNIFTRIRHHLFSLYPNKETWPWIREMILSHEDYSKWEYRFEFQCMIRSSCEAFGDDFLAIDDRERIFEAILSGPSRQDFQEWAGDKFTEELFEDRKFRFHAMQLRPFGPVLFGKYLDYFQKLVAGQEEPIKNDDYAPLRLQTGVKVRESSPKSNVELKEMRDEEILAYINDWQDAHYDPETFSRHISISGLADEFQSVFKEAIIPDSERLRFWFSNRNEIKRPIYVRAIISAIREHVELKNFEELSRWFKLCEWVLRHEDHPREEEGFDHSDERAENPDWYSSRRAVGDFIESCLKDEVDIPICARKDTAALLDMLCTQYDWRLDEGKPVLLNQDDPLTEAINNTRSLALESLGKFGDWVRRKTENQPTPEVFDILGRRFSPEAAYPLTVPEYAILGRWFGFIWEWSQSWATEHKKYFFPQDTIPAWKTAFESHLAWCHPRKPIFDAVKSELVFALENIGEFEVSGDQRNGLAHSLLGKHLFQYYLGEAYPLTGESSLLEKFYESTEGNKAHWADLFGHVGRMLRNNERLESGIKQRIIEYFDWRLEKKDKSELKEFTFWLKAGCLDAEWRLTSYLKILDVPSEADDVAAYTEMEALHGMLEDHTSLVLECFAKLTGLAYKNRRVIYIQTEKAKQILRAGLESPDDLVKANAEQARENLLRCGVFGVLSEAGE